MSGMSNIDFTKLDGERLLTTLQQRAVAYGVSDLHLSPQKSDVRLEWRQHGIILPIANISQTAYADLLRRVKFLSKLKLNVTNVPQDGQYTFEVSDYGLDVVESETKNPKSSISRIVNIRVATLPSRFGEAITLRLLDPDRGIRPLGQLGFPGVIETAMKTLMEIPNGLILVTGPTGSGKTTTLYALLSTIIGKERNIITLEDPVEYEMTGIIQSEIDPDHDFSFATGLRSVLRHDPDVILVGEIRDLETAQTAVNAALTGHLVLSTLHTNSAVETIARLLSMGVSPYTLAPSLRAVLAQRLVRTLTDDCKASGTCDPCAHATYGGQMSLPELLVVSPAIQKLILNLSDASIIEAQAKKDGCKSMKEWGEEAVQQKRTTKEEVARVTG